MKKYLTILAVIAALHCSAQWAVGDYVVLRRSSATLAKNSESTLTTINFGLLGTNGSGAPAFVAQSDFQSALVSGTSIKTINGNSLLGSGDLVFVVDGITNGIIGSAPTQNAVFDALALKADISSLGTLATQNGTFSGTHSGTSSGTNTGDQTITLTGNVTGSGTGSFAATIANNAVTYAKMQLITAGTILGSPSVGLGTVQEMTCTTAGFALLDDASNTVQRATLAAAPLSATYITQTANSELSAEQAMGSLATGLVKNTTTTGVQSIAVAGTDYLTPTGSAAGLTSFPTLNQNTTGSAASLTTGRTMAITGDLAYTSPSFDGTGNVTAAGTLATVNSNTGTFGSATQTGTFTVNGKGLITAASNATITPAVGSITGLGTGIATALAVNTGSAGAPVLFNGAGGTPSSITLTNATGTAASLTSGTVTTNANLTGVVTSTGNATAIADAALSIAKTSGLQTALDAKESIATLTPSWLTYSGGSQAYGVTSLADVNSTTFTFPSTGLYHVQYIITYDANATTTGALFSVNGTSVFDYISVFVSYRVLATDRSTDQSAGFNGGVASTSSNATSSNRGLVDVWINVTTVGTILLRAASEVVVASGITVTDVKGFMQKTY